MSHLKIIEPFCIEIQILEFDERLYSLHLSLNYFVTYFQGKLIEINNQLWIDCKAWDDFILQIHKIKLGESKSAVLSSMSSELIFDLHKDDRIISFAIHCNKLVNQNVRIQNLISSSISIEQLENLYNQLNSFEKWW